MAQYKNIDIVPDSTVNRIHLSQGDIGRTLIFYLFENALSWSVPASSTIKCQGTKPSGFGFSVSCTYSGNTVTCVTTDEMTDEYGQIEAELLITSSDESQVFGTSNFILDIERNPHPDGTVDGDAENPVIANLNAVITQATYDWLDEHPEATTTVTDGSITESKLASALATKINNKADTSALTNEVIARADADTALSNQIAALQGAVGSPLVASTVAGMTDTTKIYVYTGSEIGYTSGDWYYYNGSAWVSGGVYNAVAINTDKTLSVAGMAADAEAVGEFKNEFDLVIEETKNLANLNEVIIGKAWNGSSNSARACLFIPMEAGTKYAISFAINPFDAIYAYDKASIASTSYLTSTKVTNSGYTSTAPTNTHYLCLGFNKTAISKSDFAGIKLQVELGDSSTAYVPWVGAEDFTLREKVDEFYDTIYSDKISNKLVMVGSMRGETDASIRRGYRLFASDDGVNFNLSSLQLPSELDQTAGAPFAYQYHDWFIVGTHTTDDYDLSNLDKECLQLFVTKDLVTWKESIIFFPETTWSVTNYACSLFVDTNDDLYCAWSYVYQNGTVTNALNGTSNYFKPCYMSLSIANDGTVTSDRVYHGITGIPLQADNADTSYIDPSIIYANVIYSDDSTVRHSKVCVALKNEITSQIELWVGDDLTSMSKIRTYLGHGVESPSIFYDEDSNVFTIYASGYLYGSEAIDILLYDSFNFADRLSTGIWSLAEYYSNSRIRHPYISQISKNIDERLKDYPIVPGIAYPSERHVNLKVQNGALVDASGNDKNYQFVTHPRIKYYITGSSAATMTKACDIAPIQGQDLNVMFYLDANVNVKILLGDGFGGLKNKYLSVSNTIKAYTYVTFKEFDSNVFNPIWCPDIYTLNNLIEE